MKTIAQTTNSCEANREEDSLILPLPHLLQKLVSGEVLSALPFRPEESPLHHCLDRKTGGEFALHSQMTCISIVCFTFFFLEKIDAWRGKFPLNRRIRKKIFRQIQCRSDMTSLSLREQEKEKYHIKTLEHLE